MTGRLDPLSAAQLQPLAIKGYDQERGASYIETESLPSTHRQLDAWIDDSWASVRRAAKYRRRNGHGANTLAAMAENCLIVNLRHLTFEAVQSMPKHIALRFWEAVCKQRCDSLRAWVQLTCTHGNLEGLNTKVKSLDGSTDLSSVVNGLQRMFAEGIAVSATPAGDGDPQLAPGLPKPGRALSKIGFPFITYVNILMRLDDYDSTKRGILTLSKLSNLLALGVCNLARKGDAIDDRFLTALVRTSRDGQGFPSLRILMLENPDGMTPVGVENLRLMPALFVLGILFTQTGFRPIPFDERSIWSPMCLPEQMGYDSVQNHYFRSDLTYTTLRTVLRAAAKLTESTDNGSWPYPSSSEEYGKALVEVHWEARLPPRSKISTRRAMSLLAEDDEMPPSFFMHESTEWYVRKTRMVEQQAEDRTAQMEDEGASPTRKRPKIRQWKQPMQLESFLGL